jgi:hypothetical protein
MILLKYIFSNHQNDFSPQITKLKNLESLKVIFQALETSAASDISVLYNLAGLYSPFFLKKLPDPDFLIILATKMTNTGPLVWIESSKLQFFTDIWYPFCQRLLRPAFVIFLKIG